MRRNYSSFAIGLVLAGVVLAFYWPVTGFDFIALDDQVYIHENDRLRQGLSADAIVWALTSLHTTNWHPLTWLSLMADYRLYGLNASGYHVSSLLLHLLNTLLLFAVLRRMTGRQGRSAVVACLFALHPLNIESVVWIAERKNLLSTLFGLLTLFAYARYVEQPGWRWYLVALLCFSLGLTAKPMLVSLPVILLLSDYWPLRRVPDPGHLLEEKGREVAASLLAEKAPYFVLALLSSLVTLYAANKGGAVKSLAVFPFADRIANALVSYVAYLGRMVWPTDLSIFYPYVAGRPAWQAAAAGLLLAATTGCVLRYGRRRRYLILGWFWFLVTLLPVIGIVQVGFQSMANRYAYLSLIGIFVSLVWGAADLLHRLSRSPYLSGLAAGLPLIALAVCLRLELPHWRDSEAAFSRALLVTKNNHIAELGIGNVLQGRGQADLALSHYREALRIKPDYAEACNNIGFLLMRTGKGGEAEVYFRLAIRNDPLSEKAYNNLGALLAMQGRHPEAVSFLARALELKPDYIDAMGNMAALRMEKGDLTGAINQLRAAVRIHPADERLRQRLREVETRRKAASGDED
jgi:tetratricopeptide (TPR) repeat protein